MPSPTASERSTVPAGTRRRIPQGHVIIEKSLDEIQDRSKQQIRTAIDDLTQAIAADERMDVCTP
ncbi:hypothetical protein CTZ28_13435 [Streptomyces shenzhenensis]|uniref:Uncharacterized protein n=1 Tax=Streptomyces shenzhenensis TaxID=943815 RepID=A0A3M0IAV3_9ACTN|nr:hypothetical protein CTZ28_13435 [Streptomyces shenzhenensis]